MGATSTGINITNMQVYEDHPGGEQGLSQIPVERR